MTAPNGHANRPETQAKTIPDAPVVHALGAEIRTEHIQALVGELEIPFDPSVIDWRVTNTTKNGKLRGQVIPYADQRAYTDRLNALVTPAGWTRKYAVHTSPNFQRGKDQKTVAKVLVTCELSIHGIGTHSATGEEWADDDNAGTSAEAQAFKRACSCFGLGRYLYHFEGVWVDLDERKRPKSVPKLPKWATPAGWREGLRPQRGAVTEAPSADGLTRGNVRNEPNAAATADNRNELISKIEALAAPLGTAMYRGFLKTLANVWQPGQIADRRLLERVLRHMESAHRGLQRIDAAINRVGPEPLSAVLRSLDLVSLDQVHDLETLKKIVVAMESGIASAPTPKRQN